MQSFLLLILVFSIPAHSAAENCWELSAAMEREHSVVDESTYLALRQRLLSRDAFIRENLFDQAQISEVSGPLDSLKHDFEGAGSFAVMKVQTAAGPMVLKLFSTQPFARMSSSGGWEEMRAIDEAIVQKFSAEHGFGVPITGVVDRNQINQLLGRFPDIWNMKFKRHAGGDHPEWGILMPLMDSPYNPKRRMMTQEINPLPDYASQWDWARMQEWFDRMHAFWNKLEVRTYDFQVLIGRNGQPYVMDTPYLVFDVERPNFGFRVKRGDLSSTNSSIEGIFAKMVEAHRRNSP